MTTSAALVVLIALAAVPYSPPRRPRRAARQARAPADVVVDEAVLIDLTVAALRSGATVPGALQALGRAIGAAPGGSGSALERAGTVLLLGGTWPEAWADCPSHLGRLSEALEPAWVDGADPTALLERAARAVREDRYRRDHEAAARLGVQLVLPLGLCFLPAFILLGLVPVLLSAGAELLTG